MIMTDDDDDNDNDGGDDGDNDDDDWVKQALVVLECTVKTMHVMYNSWSILLKKKLHSKLSMKTRWKNTYLLAESDWFYMHH